tara:strand:+ start:633 stop:860 length:228 start_codon:yes stop_codon:yes gene_type:complete
MKKPVRNEIIIGSTCYGCETHHRLKVNELSFEKFMLHKGKPPAENADDIELLIGFKRKAYLCPPCKHELLADIPL